MIKTRIVIAGGRDFNDFQLLKTKVDEITKCLKSEIEIISGTASGADELGERYAIDNGYKIKRFPANWNLYGKSAGPRRNVEMAKYAAEENGVLLAFWNGKSKGTKNMIENAKKHGLRIEVISY